MHLPSLLLALFLSFSPALLQAGQVDINHASASALAQHLKGVGITKAKAIIAYRQQHGPFKKPQDLINVKGIGKKTLSKNMKNIVIKPIK